MWFKLVCLFLNFLFFGLFFWVIVYLGRVNIYKLDKINYVREKRIEKLIIYNIDDFCSID